jgi:hypothetical protein
MSDGDSIVVDKSRDKSREKSRMNFMSIQERLDDRKKSEEQEKRVYQSIISKINFTKCPILIH